jgi:TolA-binding protein
VGVSSRHWAAALADGKFGEILDEAQDLGLDRAFATSTADDLAALADAARYLRRYYTAQGALLAERSRFPNSDHAHAAAFSLGRLAETRREPRSALSWFETYLSEVSDGIYASEALGRKMLLVDQLEGKDAARPLADIYLRRFPSGTYADPARALTRQP